MARLRFTPVRDFSETYVGWTIKFAAQHEWRVGPLYDADDIVSEGYLIFRKLNIRYPQANDAQLFAIYSRSMFNLVHELSNQRTTKFMHSFSSDESEDAALLEAAQDSDFAFEMLLSEFEPDIAAFIRSFVSGEVRYERKAGVRETTLQMLKRVLSLHEDIGDLRAAFTSIFGEQYESCASYA